MTNRAPIRIAVVGVRGMGRRQARLLCEMPEFELVAICDLQSSLADEVAAENGCRAFTDFAELLADTAPDAVAVCTPNTSHAALTIQAAEAESVRGVFCEKPMAVSLRDARAMLTACRENDTRLAVNHQRRLGSDLTEARRLILSGAIGEPVLYRGSCKGDFLSDGDHVVDSLQFLSGDRPAHSVFGALQRDPDDGPERADGKPPKGYRYGHPVENGMVAQVRFGPDAGPEMEITTGSCTGFTAYQNYEVTGTEGTLWRCGDRERPNLYIADGKGGSHHVALSDRWYWAPAPAEEGGGLWRPATQPEESANVQPIQLAYESFSRSLLANDPSPIDGHIALRNIEIVMAAYESARLRRTVPLPLDQDAFPLEVMLALS